MPGKNRSRDGKDHAPTSFIRANYVQPPNKIFPVRRRLNLLLLNCCVPPIPPKTVK